MADITMCTNVLCPNAPHCYRVQAIPDEYQSVCNFEYTVSPDGVLCDYYWPTEFRHAISNRTEVPL